jgi:hypothetical protein
MQQHHLQSLEPQPLGDLEAQAHLTLYEEKDTSDIVDTTSQTSIQRPSQPQQVSSQQTTTSLPGALDLFCIFCLCISFNFNLARMTFNKYHNKTIIVDRDIGDACVICCLYIASILKGFVEARVVRMLLKQAAKLLQSGGLKVLQMEQQRWRWMISQRQR